MGLDQEKQHISDVVDQLIDKDKLKSVDNLKEELAFAKEAAANYFRKDKRVNIRISSNDLTRLKQKAAYKGLPPLIKPLLPAFCTNMRLGILVIN